MIMDYTKICKLIGHTVKFHSGPYPICSRCGSHGYVNMPEWEMSWHYLPYRPIWAIKHAIWFWKWERRKRR